MNKAASIEIREVAKRDITALNELELRCFETDRLSKRRIRHWVTASNRIFLVATQNDSLLGYCLILLHSGTRLARLYSIAVAEEARGQGLSNKLLTEAEELAAEQGRLFMRLEVAQNNVPAIALYERMGYVTFGEIEDYYEDHQNALRMQKRIRYIPQNLLSKVTPWYAQSTDFSCGPAALMMAMASLNNQYKPQQTDELNLWRESTTIFMTSGHGGCHPIGLALAARKRGFKSKVIINQTGVPFIESVRQNSKREILKVVDNDFRAQAKAAGVTISHAELRQQMLEEHLNNKGAVIVLISTFRLDGKKAPHWVTVTGMDDLCFYLHDPDPGDGDLTELDCQHIPVARNDFEKMASFGRSRLRTAVFLSNN